MRAVDIAGVMDIVGNKRGVMHILVHIGNQRVMDVVVDIGRVMNIMIDKRGVMHLASDIGGVMDIDSIVRQFTHPEGGDKVLTGSGNESQRILLRAVAPPDKKRPEIRDGCQRHRVTRSVFSATRHPAKGVVVSRNGNGCAVLHKVSKVAPVGSTHITQQCPAGDMDGDVHSDARECIGIDCWRVTPHGNRGEAAAVTECGIPYFSYRVWYYNRVYPTSKECSGWNSNNILTNN